MKVLVDTNIFVYLYDLRDQTKRERALAALAADQEIVISTQVLIEVHAVLQRKLGYSRAEAADVIALMDYPTVSTDRVLVERAAGLAAAHDLSIFDAMIVEAAAASGCAELWTEDLATGATIRGVRIVNPLA